MSQNDFNIANQGFPSFRSDLNSALQALASNSAGTSEPSTTYAYQFWYDETNELLKMRNSDNDAWITLAAFDQATDEWEVRTAVVQAVDSSGISIKTDDGVTRLAISDSGAVTINGNLAVDTDTLYVDSANNRVGIGTNSPSAVFHSVSSGSSDTGIFERGDASGTSRITIKSGDGSYGTINAPDGGNTLAFFTGGSEACRLDSSGNLLVGKTSADGGVTSGHDIRATGLSYHTVDGGVVTVLNRLTSDGDIALFRKDGSTVGSIGSRGGADLYIGSGDTNFKFAAGSDAIVPATAAGADRDNVIDLGVSSVRYDDIYATNGTIQTSDRNEKQDIEALSDAEQRVAVAAKGLLRKYRWKDAVAEKGDAARIHFGIIAQDLQAAFEAEGLDAGRYGMFISSTWWEATETYTDDEGVEQIRTNTYETQEEAPEGATERTRMGVRYPQLLAFIIAAI